MWLQLRRTALLCALFVCSSLLSVSHAISVADGQQSVLLTFEEYNKLSRNLTMLQSNSTKQLERINQLESLLQVAELSTDESNRALIEARQQLNEAREQTQEQARQLRRLNERLERQNERLSKTQASLQTANQSLKELSDELKKRQTQDKKNKIIIAAITVVAVYCASK